MRNCYYLCLISLILNVIGQQLVQMPDGKLHVFSTAQAGAATATQPASPRPAAPTPATQQVTVVKTPGGQPIIRQLRPVTPLKSNTVAGKPGQVMFNLFYFLPYFYKRTRCSNTVTFLLCHQSW